MTKAVSRARFGAVLCVLIANACFDFEEPVPISGAAGAAGVAGIGGAISSSGGSGGNTATGGNSPSGGDSSGGAPAQGDAGTGGGSGCDSRAPFETVVPLEELNSLDVENGFALTADQLVAYFASDRVYGNVELLSATRTEPSGPFADITNIDLLNDDYNQLEPALSADGLTLYFAVNGILYIAERPNRTEPFSDRTEISPGGELTGNGDPFVTYDGNSLYFSSEREGGSGAWDIWVSGIAQNGALTPPIPVPGLNTETEEWAPVLSADQLTIYFESTRAAGGFSDSNIWVAHRSRVEDDFGEAEFVEELNLHPDTDFPEAISPDNCRLYFISNRSGDLDIFVATRSPPDP